MFEKVLPIGTIVLLKGGNKRVMIIGHCKYNGSDRSKIYDYAGYTRPNQTALFDHDQIDVVFSLGYRNGKQYEFQKKLEKALAEMDREESTKI